MSPFNAQKGFGIRLQNTKDQQKDTSFSLAPISMPKNEITEVEVNNTKEKQEEIVGIEKNQGPRKDPNKKSSTKDTKLPDHPQEEITATEDVVDTSTVGLKVKNEKDN